MSRCQAAACKNATSRELVRDQPIPYGVPMVQEALSYRWIMSLTANSHPNFMALGRRHNQRALEWRLRGRPVPLSRQHVGCLCAFVDWQ